MNRAKRTIMGSAAMIALVGLGSSIPAAAQSDSATTVARVDLRPLNGSGASGMATLRLSADERTLTVMIEARGLEPGGAHISHIHGLSENGEAVNSSCPTSAQDTDGDGFVELLEGLATYGPILVDFSDVDPDADGVVRLRKTIQLSGNEMALPLNLRHIVIHGKTVPPGPGEGTPGEVNGTNGYLTVLPVLCGEIQQKGRPMASSMSFSKSSGHNHAR